jgi:hypothetical protein
LRNLLLPLEIERALFGGFGWVVRDRMGNVLVWTFTRWGARRIARRMIKRNSNRDRETISE